MNRILVTGGNGYLGSALIQRLVSRGIEVHAVANQNRSRLNALIPPDNIHPVANDMKAVEALTVDLCPDVIFHLAAKYIVDPQIDEICEMIGSNLAFGTALLRGTVKCRPQPVFVNTGSFWQFSGHGAFLPNTFYAATKQAFMDLMLFFQRTELLRATTLILYDTFGPDDPRPKLWTKVLNASSGDKIALTEGRQLVELVHVSDVTNAFLHAAELLVRGENLGLAYAVRSNEALSLKALVEKLNSLNGNKMELGWGETPYKEEQIFNPWQGPFLPGWRPQVSIEQAASEYLKRRKLEIGTE